jgi:hypothetical protein
MMWVSLLMMLEVVRKRGWRRIVAEEWFRMRVALGLSLMILAQVAWKMDRLAVMKLKGPQEAVERIGHPRDPL